MGSPHSSGQAAVQVAVGRRVSCNVFSEHASVRLSSPLHILSGMGWDLPPRWRTSWAALRGRVVTTNLPAFSPRNIHLGITECILRVSLMEARGPTRCDVLAARLDGR